MPSGFLPLKGGGVEILGLYVIVRCWVCMMKGYRLWLTTPGFCDRFRGRRSVRRVKSTACVLIHKNNKCLAH